MENSFATWVKYSEILEKINFADTTVLICKQQNGQINAAYLGDNNFDSYGSFINPAFLTHEDELKEKYPNIEI